MRSRSVGEDCVRYKIAPTANTRGTKKVAQSEAVAQVKQSEIRGGRDGREAE